MRAVAILGASGFIGTRIVEMWHLGDVADVRPVVRTASSLARLSRFALDGRIADVRDEQSLVGAFAGCDVVVHAVSGSPALILAGLAPVYRAAQYAGVRRLVYLSSASVHGQAPQPGTDDESPLDERQLLPYNNAKVRAERILGRLHERGRVELVVLRPGIVFGPRSYWVSSFADALLTGSAYLVNDGHGICNSVYVDNLVHGIERAMTVGGIDGEAFLLGDRERVTWLQLYTPIAEALGFEMDRVARVKPARAPTWRDRLSAVSRSQRSKALRSLLPASVRRTVSTRFPSLLRPAGRPSPWVSPLPPPPEASLEMTLLHTCKYRLPHEKATRLLGYEPPVSFKEGCRRTIGWMEFAGYTVRSSPDLPAAGATSRPDALHRKS